MQITREKILRMVGTTIGGTTRTGSSGGGGGGGGDAQYAAEAGHALTADLATNAAHATTADSATEATHATSADTATRASSSASADNLATNSTDWLKIMRKDIAQTAAEVITFAKGIISTLKSYFSGGIEVTGGTTTDTLNASGNVDVDGVLTAGKSEIMAAIIDWLKSKNIVTENLTVTGAAHFFSLIIDELKSQQGAVIITSAHCKADRVVAASEVIPGTPGHIVYFRASDADGNKVTNAWLIGDQAICQTFNVAAGTSYQASNRYYWCLVEDVSTAPVTLDDGNAYHYIVLSGTTYATGSMTPEAGDDIVQLGYRGSDSTVLPGRRSAIILSAYPTPDTELVPAIFAKYAGINNFDLTSHRETFLDASRSRFVGEFQVRSGGRTISISNAIAEEMMGGAANYLKGSDFATAADIADCWTKEATAAADVSNITVAADLLDGQHCMQLATPNTILRLRQTVTSMADLPAGTTLCLSAYVRMQAVTPGSSAIGVENFSAAFGTLAWTGDNVLGSSRSGSGGRYYAQIRLGDTEWHRVWATFTPANMASFDIGLFGWCDSSVSAANRPTFEVALAKLEVGTEPTQWTPTADQLRRAGIDIIGGNVMIYGDHIKLDGTVTANNGFGINLDGSMFANNGTFAGIVRTKMQAVTPANAADKLSEDTDFVIVDDDHTTGTYGYLIPQQCPAGVQTDILKTGAAVLFDPDNSLFSDPVQIHLPFVYPYDEPGNTMTFEAAFKQAYNDNTAYWAEVLRSRSYVGAVVEIVNQMGSGESIALCGIKDSGSFPSSPWVLWHLPYGGAIRLECVRETSGGSSTAFLDNVYWRVVGYTTGISIPLAAVQAQ